MALSAFPYPGGKTPYWTDIIQYFPQHRRYVEPFGGSAAVLLNKPESYVEVYNDRDSDVVHFFRVVREQRDELKEWLRTVPFSRELYEDWQQQYDQGLRPTDDVERAGRWFALRYMNYGGSPDRRAGFKASGKRNEARSFRGGIDTLDAVVDRLQEVTLENQDYKQVLDRYDSEGTLFYLDPPYVDVGDRYYDTHGGFDHVELVDALRDRDGHWICSYGELPDGLEDVAIDVREYTAMYSITYTEDSGRQEATERLAMNFDPDQTPAFSVANQSTLSEIA